MQEEMYVIIDGRTLPSVRHSSDPYGVKGRDKRVDKRFWHLDCQPRIRPEQVEQRRDAFFESWRNR